MYHFYANVLLQCFHVISCSINKNLYETKKKRKRSPRVLKFVGRLLIGLWALGRSDDHSLRGFLCGISNKKGVPSPRGSVASVATIVVFRESLLRANSASKAEDVPSEAPNLKRLGEEAGENWIQTCLDLPRSVGQATAEVPGAIVGRSASTAAATTDTATAAATAIDATPRGSIRAVEALEKGEVWSPAVGLEEEDALPTKEVLGQGSAQCVTALPARGPVKRRCYKSQHYSPSLSLPVAPGVPLGTRVARLEAGRGSAMQEEEAQRE